MFVEVRKVSHFFYLFYLTAWTSISSQSHDEKKSTYFTQQIFIFNIVFFFVSALNSMMNQTLYN